MRVGAAMLAVVLGAAGVASAQSAMYLVPERASLELGQAVRLRAAAGTDAEAPGLAWPAERIGHFFARTAWTQENRDSLAPEAGDDTLAPWPADRPGVLLLGVDLEPAPEVVTADAFAAFVARVLPEAARLALGDLPGAGDVTLLRTESAKALVIVHADGADPVSIATSKSGQAVELRPLMDPTSLRPGSDMAVRAYAAIPGAAGGMVIATNTTTAETVHAPTDDSGIANVPIAGAGRWRLEFHAVARAIAPPQGAASPAFQVHTATMTFDVAPEDER